MATYEKCPLAVNKMAEGILKQFETHQPLIDAGVTTDFVFAYAEKDETTGEPIGDALTKGGVKCLGICRKIGLKDRALGRGDTEIAIDGDWWTTASEEEQRALLDHELHHIAVKIDKRGLVRDDLGRPIVQMRKHDVEVGWFKVIAARHGLASQERLQAVQIMVDQGQYFWPGLAPLIEKNPKLLSE
jgi:Putative phage metallopeptidase